MHGYMLKPDTVYDKALANARREERRLFELQEEALSHLSDNDRIKIAHSKKIPWVSAVCSSPAPHWGMVCFRTFYSDEILWERYKEHLKQSVRTGLLYANGPHDLIVKWKIYFVEDRAVLEDAAVEDVTRSGPYSIYPNAVSRMPNPSSFHRHVHRSRQQ